ncbi:proteinase [Streptomyces mashuensis]|uniref:Proteinase n=1 Tax=Streptomyces mashuensis TaxID=33904 RepID=A0A919EF55_9ACTN|nr:alpha/beta hydrolase [Streptomyces mashuensis]GHF62864.1 proteinase [Streptomyces mashuensis]
MDSTRLLRRSGTFAAAAALLLSAVVPADAVPARAPEPGGVAGSAAAAASPAPPLRPLPTAVPAALRRYYGQKLAWHSCGGKRAGFECATLRAPLDYAAPRRGGDIKLAVSRKKATGPGAKLGSLMVNPGGPGGSAVGFLQAFAGTRYPRSVRARYDMVAMDPRGVAGSEPVTCLSDARMDEFAQVDQTPDDDAEVRRLVAAYREYANGCAARSGRLLRHVSTVEAARDMDLFRAVLGDDKLHYVGASYGTFLGATYAGLFPSRVGRLVLDGALDPSLDAQSVNRDQTAGFQTAFESFAEDCAEHEDCTLAGGGPGVAGTRLKAFFDQLDSQPLPTGTRRDLTESLATTGVISAMYDQAAWPLLRRALNDAQNGDGALLLRLSDAYYERDEHGSYTNLMAANSAVNCLDQAPPFRSPAGVRRALPAFEKASPAFGTSFAWGALTCAYWPVKATGGPHRITARGAAPILVVGTTRDPATPYRWARGLAGQLSSGRLLTYEGDGHTAYNRGSSCVDSAINDYLLTTTAPPAQRRCT